LFAQKHQFEFPKRITEISGRRHTYRDYFNFYIKLTNYQWLPQHDYTKNKSVSIQQLFNVNIKQLFFRVMIQILHILNIYSFIN